MISKIEKESKVKKFNINPEILAVIAISEDAANEQISNILKDNKIPTKSFNGIIEEDGQLILCTNQANFDINSSVRIISKRETSAKKHPGRNVTGGYLPPSGGGGYY